MDSQEQQQHQLTELIVKHVFHNKFLLKSILDNVRPINIKLLQLDKEKNPSFKMIIDKSIPYRSISSVEWMMYYKYYNLLIDKLKMIQKQQNLNTCTTSLSCSPPSTSLSSCTATTPTPSIYVNKSRTNLVFNQNSIDLLCTSGQNKLFAMVYSQYNHLFIDSITRCLIISTTSRNMELNQDIYKFLLNQYHQKYFTQEQHQQQHFFIITNLAISQIDDTIINKIFDLKLFGTTQFDECIFTTLDLKLDNINSNSSSTGLFSSLQQHQQQLNVYLNHGKIKMDLKYLYFYIIRNIIVNENLNSKIKLQLLNYTIDLYYSINNNNNNNNNNFSSSPTSKPKLSINYKWFYPILKTMENMGKEVYQFIIEHLLIYVDRPIPLHQTNLLAYCGDDFKLVKLLIEKNLIHLNIAQLGYYIISVQFKPTFNRLIIIEYLYNLISNQDDQESQNNQNNNNNNSIKHVDSNSFIKEKEKELMESYKLLKLKYVNYVPKELDKKEKEQQNEDIQEQQLEYKQEVEEEIIMSLFYLTKIQNMTKMSIRSRLIQLFKMGNDKLVKFIIDNFPCLDLLDFLLYSNCTIPQLRYAIEIGGCSPSLYSLSYCQSAEAANLLIQVVREKSNSDLLNSNSGQEIFITNMTKLGRLEFLPLVNHRTSHINVALNTVFNQPQQQDQQLRDLDIEQLKEKYKEEKLFLKKFINLNPYYIGEFKTNIYIPNHCRFLVKYLPLIYKLKDQIESRQPTYEEMMSPSFARAKVDIKLSNQEKYKLYCYAMLTGHIKTAMLLNQDSLIGVQLELLDWALGGGYQISIDHVLENRREKFTEASWVLSGKIGSIQLYKKMIEIQKGQLLKQQKYDRLKASQEKKDFKIEEKEEKEEINENLICPNVYEILVESYSHGNIEFIHYLQKKFDHKPRLLYIYKAIQTYQTELLKWFLDYNYELGPTNDIQYVWLKLLNNGFHLEQFNNQTVTASFNSTNPTTSLSRDYMNSINGSTGSYYGNYGYRFVNIDILRLLVQYIPSKFIYENSSRELVTHLEKLNLLTPNQDLKSWVISKSFKFINIFKK